MKPFKSFLLEYLTRDQRHFYENEQFGMQPLSMLPERRKKTDHFFGVGNDEIEQPIDMGNEKSDTHKKVEKHLGVEISPEVYRTGLVKDKYGRQAKIGKMIKDDKLRDAFANDPHRKGINNHGYTARIVRGVEVVGQSNPEPDDFHPKGHSWADESCKNLESGQRSDIPEVEANRGTVVMFVKNHEGTEVSRYTLQPYHIVDAKDEDPTEVEPKKTVYAINGSYGLQHPAFKAHAEKIARQLSGKYKRGIYRLDPDVYNDRSDSKILHPATTTKHLEKLFSLPHDTKNKNWNDVLRFKLWAFSHSKMTPDIITQILKNPKESYQIKERALKQDDLITPEHINHVVKNETNPYILHQLQRHENLIDENHITHLLTNEKFQKNNIGNPFTFILNHPKANKEHLMLAVNHVNDGMRYAALFHIKNNNANSSKFSKKEKMDIFTKLSNDKRSEIRTEAEHALKNMPRDMN